MTGKIVLSALFSAVLLAGCQAPPYSITEKFDLSVASLDSNDIRKTGEKDAFGQSQILTAETGSMRFGVAYISTNHMGVIKELISSPRLILKAWTDLNPKTFDYGGKGEHDLPGDYVDYERFSFPGHRCFHFLSAFNKSPFDEFGRYKRMITGYYCDSSGQELSDNAIFDFLNGITVPRHSADIAVRNLPNEGLFKPIRPIRGRLIRSTKQRWITG